MKIQLNNLKLYKIPDKEVLHFGLSQQLQKPELPHFSLHFQIEILFSFVL